MPPIENEPLEVRKAYAISELEKIVNQSATLSEAKEKCKQMLIELVEQGVVRSDDVEVQEIKEIIKVKMSHKFDVESQAKNYSKEGDELRAAKKHDGAIEAYQRAIDLNPKDVSYHNRQGISYYSSGQYEKAINAFQRAIDLEPGKAIYHNNQADSYRKNGQYEKAIEAYQRAIDLNPKDVSYHNRQGISYYSSGQYEKAIEAYQRAIDLEPREAVYHDNQGDSYLKNGQYEKAIEAYQRAIDLKPDNALYHKDQGSAYRWSNQHEKAIEAYQRAIDLDKHCPAEWYEALIEEAMLIGRGREMASKVELLVKDRKMEGKLKADVEESILMGRVLGLVPGWVLRKVDNYLDAQEKNTGT